MSTPIDKQTVVVGAGMGGLAAAAALADHFEHVIMLERDALPRDTAHRPGTPQSKHVHALLAGGQNALGELFPGFEQDLARAGAVPLRVGLDLRSERPGYDPFPQRDLGWLSYAMSRPLIEGLVRQRVAARANIEVRPRCRARALVVSDGAVTAVRCEQADGASETLPADLVVDASGGRTLTLSLLASIGRPRPEETTIGVDVGYATAVFAIPDDAPPDWQGVFTFPGPGSSRGAPMLPLEDRRWICTVGGRHGDRPPRDEDGFMTYARELRTTTVYDAIKGAKREGAIARYGFPASVWRHFERLETFPRGLLPFADAICRFNPVYGQGMSVAAQEACLLRRLLGTQALEGDPLTGLARAFFAEAQALIDGPWAMAAIPDFLHPETRGERPPDFEATMKFGMALTRLAAADPAVHKLVAEVQHLLKPRSVYREPELLERVLAVMAAGSASPPPTR
jgi:2-polyprenyl-6-methoxyphenol hydroxylase-like FAD-dependent oxidoreductase